MKIKQCLLGGILLVSAVASSAENLLTVNLKARVTDLYDPPGALSNQLAIGQLVNASYTYDTSVADQDSHWAYGIYPQPQGKIRVMLGSLVIETDPLQAPQNSSVWVHPAEVPGYWSYFRINSWGNKRLGNGANVSMLEIDFTNFSGNSPTSDTLPAGAPSLQSFSQSYIGISGEWNGQWFSARLAIEEAMVESGLVVSPGTSTFLRPQRFDAALLLPTNTPVIDVQAKIGTTHLLFTLGESCFFMPSPQHAAILCPDAQSKIPLHLTGFQHIEWEVTLADGQRLNSAVDWTFLP